MKCSMQVCKTLVAKNWVGMPENFRKILRFDFAGYNDAGNGWVSNNQKDKGKS